MTICASDNHKSKENTKGLFVYNHDTLEEGVEGKEKRIFLNMMRLQFY